MNKGLVAGVALAIAAFVVLGRKAAAEPARPPLRELPEAPYFEFYDRGDGDRIRVFYYDDLRMAGLNAAAEGYWAMTQGITDPDTLYLIYQSEWTKG